MAKELGRSVKVSVTQRDIRCGVPEDASKCAIARAVKRTTRHRFVEVERDGITLDNQHGEHLWTFSAPGKVERFIDRFDYLPADERRALKPFTFVMRHRGV